MNNYEKIKDNFFIYNNDDIEEFKKFINELHFNNILIYFYANWCGPCKKFFNRFEEITTKYNDILFLKINVNKCTDISIHYNILNIPTFKFINSDLKENYEIVGIDDNFINKKLLDISNNFNIIEEIKKINIRLDKIENQLKSRSI